MKKIAATNKAKEQARHDLDIDNIATKRDLKELELHLTIKMGAMLSLAVVVTAALVKLP